MLKDGFLTLGHVRGIPVRAHWSLPLGALVFGGVAVRPVFWAGFVLLVLLHELGHAWVVQRAGAEVLSVELSAFGGLCRWAGAVSPLQRACIAWGGVWAQALAFVGVVAFAALEGSPTSWVGAELFAVFTRANVGVAAFNLLPIPPLDGAKAWPLLPLLWRAARSHWTKGRARRRQQDVAARLARFDAAAEGEVPAEAREAVARLLAEAKQDTER